MSTAPEARPRRQARAGFMNQARPSPAAMPQAVSVTAAITTETAHIMASWNSAGSDGSTNCGRKAVKKAMVFGFESATRKPRQKCTRPGGAAPADRLEERRRASQDPGQAEGDRGDEDGVAADGAGDRHERGARPLRRAGGDDERHDRPRGHDEHEGDEEEGEEELGIEHHGSDRTAVAGGRRS